VRKMKSFESRARRFASRVDHDRLILNADRLSARGMKDEENVFLRAAQVQDEFRALESSMALADVMDDAVYDQRPNGRLPSDGIGIDL
jgi:hypothetical protein